MGGVSSIQVFWSFGIFITLQSPLPLYHIALEVTFARCALPLSVAVSSYQLQSTRGLISHGQDRRFLQYTGVVIGLSMVHTYT